MEANRSDSSTLSSASVDLEPKEGTITGATQSTLVQPPQPPGDSHETKNMVSLAQFMDIVNAASVAVAVVNIAKDLGFDVGQMQWIISAYIVSFAGLLLVAGRIGDFFGHRRVFLGGLAWFAVWSLVIGFSKSPVMFSVARALQGIGAAFTIPTAIALIAITHPVGPTRTKALSIFGAFGALGAIFGTLLAGAFISSIGWEWLYFLTAIIAVLNFMIGYISIPTLPRAKRPVIDYPGAITITAAVVLIVYYLASGVDEGFASKKTLPALVVGIVLFAVFLVLQAKVHHPIMPFRLWGSRYFRISVILGFFTMAQFQGAIYFATLVFQQVYGWSAIKTSLGFLVHAVVGIFVFPILGRVLTRYPLKPFLVMAYVFRGGTALLFSFVTEKTSYWAIPFPALVIHVIGHGSSLLPLQVLALKDAADEDQGIVGAIYNSALQIGAPFGLAIFNVIAIHTNGNDPTVVGPILMKGYQHALFCVAAFGALSFFIALFFVPYDRPTPAKKPAQDVDVEAQDGQEVEETGGK
ncbi:hypothetical protein BGZ73_000973 [Actinomortierella ambigua]|nr:hypothetical protein BGZ73_000973 [Actinomortierella ambigua]